MVTRRKQSNSKGKVNGDVTFIPPEDTITPVTDTLNSGKTDIKYWKNKITTTLKPHKTVCINMECENGMHRTFITTIKKDGFEYNGKRYIVDDNLKYYNIDIKQYTLDYHEGFTLPIKRNIPVNEINKTVKHSGLTEVEYATNPAVLERFLTSQIAEGIMRGQQIDEFLKTLRTVIYIVAVMVFIHLILFVFKTGMLNDVTGSLGF